jgi:broad specificity phosphatase PhoE
MKIYLIRHGQMKGDPFVTPESPVTGSLSEDEGIPQAEALAKALKGRKVDKAFSSPFGRALQTAEVALKGRDIPITILPYMYEWMPDRSLEEIPSTEFEQIHDRWNDAYPEETWKTDLGEGCFDMYARICPAFLKTLDSIGVHSRYGGYVIDESAKDLSIAVFAHGGSLNILLSFLLEIRPFPAGRFSFHLTGVAELNYTERKGVYYPELVIPAMASD